MDRGGGIRVLIAGCGYVGSALARRLAEDGHRVHGLRRRTDPLPPEIEPIRADLTDPGTLTGLPGDLDAVVYCASPGERSESAYREAYVIGVENLVDALGSAGPLPRRLVFTSSTAVYAQRGGAWVDERSPTEPASFSGARLLEGEETVSNGPIPGVVVRFGGIYGPGRDRLLRRVRAGEARLPADPPVWTNRIHRDDCAGALRHLLEHPDPASLYVAVDREPAPLGEVLLWLARRVGAPEPTREDAVGDPDSRLRRSNKRCRSDRLLASGYGFRHPTYREGYAALVGTTTE